MAAELSTLNIRRALADLKEGVFGSAHLWSMMAWQEIKQRYRRSILGPFWLTISTAFLVVGMGPLYSTLLHQPLGEYFTYIAVGLVLWLLISSLINESCTAFIQAEGFIKHVRLPLSLHVVRMVWRNALLFAHNAVVIVAVIAFAQPPLGWSLLLVPFALLALLVNAVWVGLLLGLLSARYRDIPPFVNSVLQIGLFLTPILWKVEMLGAHRWFGLVNPVYHFIEIVRAPLVGAGAAALSWAAVAAITVVGWAGTLAVFAKYRARIAFWV